jgi:hypothetical protein
LGAMNENHIRALRSGLLLVERRLHQIRDYLESDGSGSILYSIRSDIDPRARSRIMSVIASMLDEIGRIKEEFGLGAEEESLKRDVYAALAEVWVNLEELMPERMEAYGRMEEGDGRVLKSHILKLLKMHDEILGILDGVDPSRRTDGP